MGGVETPDAALALPKLSLSRGVAEEIQNAIAAGKEVTVHEKAINAYGFSGFGYTIIDPETGVGGYLIEGKGSAHVAPPNGTETAPCHSVGTVALPCLELESAFQQL